MVLLYQKVHNSLGETRYSTRMGKNRRSSGGGTTNSSRKNGKAWKKNPLDPNRKTSGKTSGGYTPAKLAIRATKRGM